MNLNKTLWTIGSMIGAQQAMKAVRRFELNDLLGVVGLERQPSILSRALPTLGLIAVSAAVGAGAALLLAPSSGSELRSCLSSGINDAKRKLDDKLDEAKNQFADKLDEAKNQFADGASDKTNEHRS